AWRGPGSGSGSGGPIARRSSCRPGFRAGVRASERWIDEEERLSVRDGRRTIVDSHLDDASFDPSGNQQVDPAPEPVEDARPPPSSRTARSWSDQILGFLTLRYPQA